MSLKPIYDQYEAWRARLHAQCEPLLAEARAKMCAAQHRPAADDDLARIEELVRAKLEPLLLEREADLAAIGQAVDRYLAETEEPTEQDGQWQERIGEGIAGVRDWLDRRVASLVAQARAAELAAEPPAGRAAAGPTAGMRRFCTRCGGALGPADWQARRCPACQSSL